MTLQDLRQYVVDLSKAIHDKRTQLFRAKAAQSCARYMMNLQSIVRTLDTEAKSCLLYTSPSPRD
eukprot:1532253-Alexandrium_andersonii.AAC.1